MKRASGLLSFHPWLGRWLRSTRTHSGKTVEEIARFTKVTKETVCRRETGTAFAADLLPRVLEAYGLTFDHFVEAAEKVYCRRCNLYTSERP